MLTAFLALAVSRPPVHENPVMTTQDQPLYHETLRPQFHVTARYWDDKRNEPVEHQEGWINDLNGLIYYNGEYHMFAQRWATCWLHFVSKDLVHWTELKPAFWEEKEGSGVQSGSCVIDYKNTSGLSPDPKNPPMVAFWSRFDNQSQCLDYSLDHGRTWQPYAKNPFMLKPERDPKVFWYEPGKHWVMVMYGNGAYHILNSQNLTDWTDTGHPIPDSFECPDMFELPVDGDPNNKKWVVVQGSGHYSVGTFDGKEFMQEGDRQVCDIGPNFYATQTWANTETGDGRRIQAAWMRGAKFPGMPFSQEVSFPCRLSLHTTTHGVRLFREPIKEIETLQGPSHRWYDKDLKANQQFDIVPTGNLYRVRCQFDLSPGASLEFSLCGETVILSDRQATNGSTSGEPITHCHYAEILLDRGSVELFVNHGELSSTRFALPKGQGITAKAVNGSVHISSLMVDTLKSIWPDKPPK